MSSYQPGSSTTPRRRMIAASPSAQTTPSPRDLREGSDGSKARKPPPSAGAVASPASAGMRLFAGPLRQTGPVGCGLLFVGSVFLLREAQALMVPVAVAVVLTLVLSMPVCYLRRHGVPEFIGPGLLVLSLILTLGQWLSTRTQPHVKLH